MFLEIKGIRKSYGTEENRVEVLKGIDLEVEKGQICVLLGQSGSGKSTLLNIIGGIDNADSGYVSINGEKTEDMDEKKLTLYRRKHLGYVFQMYNLIPNLNVKENIEVGAYLSDNPLDIDDLLKTLGLYEHRHKLPNQLSGGQQQRVSIGRAIVKNPDILKGLGEHKTHQLLIGFAAETEHVVDYGMDKVRRKNLDMLVANDVSKSNAGFNVDTNEGYFLYPNKDPKVMPNMKKSELAKFIIGEVIELLDIQ